MKCFWGEASLRGSEQGVASRVLLKRGRSELLLTRSHLSHPPSPHRHFAPLVIVILGASGDLAAKKTYPSLFSLYTSGLLPKQFKIIGYAR